jgi:glucose/arabinose dehydrogenase
MDLGTVIVEPVLAGIPEPVDLAFHPGGDLLVALKGGKILRFDPHSRPSRSFPYLLLEDVDSFGERGLISFALAPDFARSAHVYVYYSKLSRERFRVSRFEEQSGALDPASELLIWESPASYTSNIHFGGDIVFGPDGFLYFTTGDEANDDNPQDLRSHAGKVFRLNPDGSIPADNPWNDGSGPNIDGIWAMGLRNVFRAAWDLPTRRFFLAEVGGNHHLRAWEDLHMGEAGANYGWPPCEGLCGCDSHDAPVWTYPHGGNGAALVGGIVFRDQRALAALQESYIFGDYIQGWIKFLRFGEDGRPVKAARDILLGAGLVVSIVQGPDADIYYADLRGSVARVHFEP